MANKKLTRTRRWKRSKSDFPDVTGKSVEAVELRPSDTGYSIGILFIDRTYLSFDIEPQMTFSIVPELSSWKTGNYKPLKRWRPITS
jgi:hypothetical protein